MASTMMDAGMARARHAEAEKRLTDATNRLILMCKLKLLDRDSIQDQACLVAGCVSSEYDTRVQLEQAEKTAKRVEEAR